MLPRPWFRHGVALCVFVLLVPALAAAAPQARVPRSPRVVAFQSGPRPASFWQRLAPLWAAIGCRLDFGGAFLPASAGLDIGCHLDPSGTCRQESDRLDIGCHIDPNGACRQEGDRLDIGCAADPSGLCLPRGQ